MCTYRQGGEEAKLALREVWRQGGKKAKLVSDGRAEGDVKSLTSEGDEDRSEGLTAIRGRSEGDGGREGDGAASVTSGGSDGKGREGRGRPQVWDGRD